MHSDTMVDRDDSCLWILAASVSECTTYVALQIESISNKSVLLLLFFHKVHLRGSCMSNGVVVKVMTPVNNPVRTVPNAFCLDCANLV